jgi:signal transduction histidine kinase
LARSCAQLRGLLQSLDAPEPARRELKTILDLDLPEAMEFIQAGVAKIDLLLAGFLRYSRLGRAVLRITPLDMNAMLAHIARTVEFQLKQAGAALRVADLPPCLGDAGQINQVFSNLIDNALKYRSPGRAAVIEVSGRTENDRSVYSVRDNGVGIAPEHQARVFEMFHRLNPAATEGEGLGLAIVQRILQRHGGRVWVDSAPGAGSTFFVSLPRN